MLAKKSTIERFLNKIKINEKGCWIWTGNVSNKGYGRFRFEGHKGYAHIFSFQYFNGPIPKGHEVDHLCRDSLCSNPDHLDAVTHNINVKRGLAGIKRTHCKRGHLMDQANSMFEKNGRRHCRTCHYAQNKKFAKTHPDYNTTYHRKYMLRKKMEANSTSHDQESSRAPERVSQ